MASRKRRLSADEESQPLSKRLNTAPSSSALVLSDAAADVIRWPALNVDELRKVYDSQNKFFSAWKRTFVSKHGRMPSHRDIDREDMSGRHENLDRLRRELRNLDGTFRFKRNVFHLPAELWAQVFSFLGLDDLKSVQLVCRCFAQEAQRYVEEFPFLLYRHRPDLERLQNLPSMERHPKIRGLHFCLGFPLYEWQNEWQTAILDEEASHRFGVDILVQWRTQHYRDRDGLILAQNYRHSTELASILAPLKFVTSLEISGLVCPNVTQMLSTYKSRTTGNEDTSRTDRFQLAREHQSILDVAQKLPLIRLHLSNIPIEAFYKRRLTSREPFRALLKDLKLSIGTGYFGTGASFQDELQNIDEFLRCNPELQKLHIQFHAPPRRGIPMFWPWPSHQWLQDYTWAKLEELCLCALALYSEALLPLLQRHSSLKRLELDEMRIAGPMESLLEGIRDLSNLEVFIPSGTWAWWPPYSNVSRRFRFPPSHSSRVHASTKESRGRENRSREVLRAYVRGELAELPLELLIQLYEEPEPEPQPQPAPEPEPEAAPEPQPEPAKRGRGRPRKLPQAEPEAQPAKRGRGRPRKHPK